MPNRVALATCSELPEPDYDEPLLLAELARVGIEAETAAWDDPRVEWTSFDACVIRSTWNYHLAPLEFSEWVQRTASATRLFNSAGIVMGNLHKSYLLELEKQDVATVPTHVITDAREFEDFELPERFVLKPAVSCGSFRTRVFEKSEVGAAVGHCLWILGDCETLIQPYLPSVEKGGEIAWVWIDGEITHGIRKMPRFSEDDESVTEGFAPTVDDLDRLAPILAQIDPTCVYARIDVMEDGDDWLLSELELIEPSLFFKQFPEALPRFSEALLRRLESR